MRSFPMVAGGIAVSFLTASLLSAAEPTSNSGKDVESLLRKLSNAYVTKDMDTIRQLTSGDKVSILSGGQRKTGSWADCLTERSQVTPATRLS